MSEGSRGQADSAFVLERQQDAGAVLVDFAAIYLHIHFDNFGNAQVTHGFGGGFDRVASRILP